MYRDFSCKTAVTCDDDLDRAKDVAMRIRHTYLTAMLAASAALASTLAAAPPAAADCISSRGDNPVTLCSQGETRKSNTTQVPVTSGYVPYPCDVDWTCDNGLGIAFG